MSDITVEVGTQIRFCVAGSFSATDPATDHTIGTPTDVALTLNALANGAGRQSSKADLGANRAYRYDCHAAFDFTGETPIIAAYVHVYWLPSTHATAANGNVAGNSGVDGAAPDGAVGPPTLAEFQDLAIYIGALKCHGDGVVQNGPIGVLVPTTRYGQILVVNNSGDVFEALDTQMAVWLTPMIDDVA